MQRSFKIIHLDKTIDGSIISKPIATADTFDEAVAVVEIMRNNHPEDQFEIITPDGWINWNAVTIKASVIISIVSTAAALFLYYLHFIKK
jgi:hypothetical protein